MPRNIPVRNGKLLICFDDEHCVRGDYAEGDSHRHSTARHWQVLEIPQQSHLPLQDSTR